MIENGIRSVTRENLYHLDISNIDSDTSISFLELFSLTFILIYNLNIILHQSQDRLPLEGQFYVWFGDSCPGFYDKETPLLVPDREYTLLKREPIYAYICRECGYMEFYVSPPNQL